MVQSAKASFFPLPSLVHLPDQSVDVLLTVTQVTTLDEVLELPLVEAAIGAAELEGPEEVGSLLEVGADGVDLVDEILDTDNAVLAQALLNDGVVGQRDALLVDLAIATLVDELLDTLQVGVTVGDPRLDDLDHLRGGLGDTDKDTVVDLKETEELKDLAGLGRDLVDTRSKELEREMPGMRLGLFLLDVPLDTDDEEELGLLGNVERALLLGDASEPDLLTLGIAVLLHVLLSTLEDNGALLLVDLRGKLAIQAESKVN